MPGTYIGTQNFGNTFPGASAPFGMVQVSPDTGGQGGYDYQQDTIYGFSQTHLSGVGCPCARAGTGARAGAASRPG